MKIFHIAAICLLIGLLSGCAGNPSNSIGTKEIVISSLLKESGLGANITTIVLTVSGDDIETSTHDLAISDGVATITIEVPIGLARKFEMTAFDDADVALYRGSSVTDVFAGATTEVDIKMEPLVPMIRVSPMFSRASGETVRTISVFVHNIDSLFGASFRLEYDTALVEPVSVTAGNVFAGNDALFFTQTRPGYVAVAYTIKGNQLAQGVSVDGTIAVITFAPRAVGTSFLRIPEETLSLIDWQSGLLPRQGVLYIEEGEIRVDAP